MSTMNEGNMLIGKMQRIMELRSKGYSVDFDFPSIAVIGSQSSGKSSVIESIVGRHMLPRGTNMCTRCPIVLNLYHETDCPNDYAIFAPTQQEQNPKRIEDFSKVREEIETRTVQMIEGRHGVTDVCIVINIHSRHYPDNLQLVDLPGFVRNPVADQPADIKEQIENLVRAYIEKDNTIILAVSDACVDMAESAGIAEARKVDERGVRTVGVLTKLDLLSKEKVNDVTETLNNKLLPLSKGYVAVINTPPQNGEEEDIETLRNREKDLLKNLGFSRKVRNCGTPYLISKLSKELSQKIREKVPELITRVNEELEFTQTELDSLDYKDELKNQPHRKRIVDKVKHYETSVVIMLQGNDRRVSHKELQGGAILKGLLKRELAEARKEAMKLNPSQFGKDIEIMLFNLDASHDSVLPNSLAFRNCVAILVEKFKKPFGNLINKFTEQLTIYLRKCADDSLSLNPNLKQKIVDMTMEKVFEYRETCKNDMNKQIDIQKYFVNTSHPEFKRYHNLITGIKVAIPDPAAPIPAPVTSPVGTGEEVFHDADAEPEDLETEDADKTVKWIKERATAFCHFQRDTGDKTLAVPIEAKSRKDFFLELVLAYMLILETSLCHTALKLIMFHLNHNVVEYHENHDLYVQLLENNETKIEQYLEIDPQKKEKLDVLMQQQESCVEVLKVLRDSD
jgi:dynamin 1-like protein